MKIFITGICGFIGTYLRERLEKEGHKVYGIDNLSNPCKYYKANFIKDTILNIDKYGPIISSYDFIIHLAALINVEESLQNPHKALTINTMGTYKILEICRKYNIKMIHASSCEIYGDKQSESGMDESHQTLPKSPYAASKLGADGLCHAFYYSYGTKVVIVRNYNTFGPKQSDHKFGAVIGIFAKRIMNNQPPIVFGDGSQKRDFMGIKDAIDFYMLLIKKVESLNLWNSNFNVGMGKSITIRELAHKMIILCGKKRLLPTMGPKRPGEVKEFLCDNTKARKLGWNPDTDFDKLLKEFIDWKKSESGVLDSE